MEHLSAELAHGFQAARIMINPRFYCYCRATGSDSVRMILTIRPGAKACLLAIAGMALASLPSNAHSQEVAPAAAATSNASEQAAEVATKEAAAAKPRPQIPPPVGAKRLDPRSRVWVDAKKKQVMVDGTVTLRRGLLEMFACLNGTKEHESVVAVDRPAFLIHAALLSLGAKPGKPVQWDPEYAPPTGIEITIEAQWLDQQGKLQKTDARNWVRDLRTKKAMTQNWVFGGSGFWKDEETGKEHYLAESGDLICVSNFGTAMLDVPDNSPQSNEGLLFEAFTENVPLLGTPVRLVLKPVFKQDRSKKPVENKPASATKSTSSDK